MKQDKIWRYYQDQDPLSFRGSHSRLAYLMKLILKKSKRSGKVLNIGIGDGTLEKLAVQYFSEVWSLDLSYNAIKKIEEETKKVKGIIGHIEEINLPKNYFSVIVASEVLEHLTNTQLKKALANAYNALKPSGIFVGTVPNNENLRESIVVCPKCGEVFHRWGHHHSFSVENIKNILLKYFKEVEVYPKYFFSLKLLNWKGKIISIIKMLSLLLGVHGRGENIVFCAKKLLSNSKK